MPDPNAPKFSDPNLIKDLSDIFYSNPFVNTYTADKTNNTINMQGCISIAVKFLNGYKLPDNNSKRADAVSALLFNYQGLKTALDKTIESANDRNRFLECARAVRFHYLAIMRTEPSPSKLIYDFVSDVTKKGASLGDDGARMLLSIAQNLDDLSDRCNMQLDKEKIIESHDFIKEGKEIEQELSDMIHDYSKRCQKKNISGTALDVDAKTWSGEKSKYTRMAEEEKKKQVEHSEEYENCNKRIKDNKEKIENLNKQAEAENEKNKVFQNLMKELKGLAPKVKKLRSEANKIENDIIGYRDELEQINENIEIGEQKLAQYQKSRDFIANMPQEQKESIAKAQQLISHRAIISKGYHIFSQFNFDFSDSYRAFLKSHDMTGISPENQQKISFYDDLKGKMISADPSLKAKFDAFEMNPENKIPADFYKCMKQDMINSINKCSDAIKDVRKTKLYQDYMEACTDIDIFEADKLLLETLKTEKSILEEKIKEAQDKLPAAKEKAAEWAKPFKDALGSKFPEKVTAGNIGSVISSKIRSSNTNLEKINKEKSLLEKSIEADSKKMASLKEDMNKLKIIGLGDEINKCNDKLDAIKDFKEEKKELQEYVENFGGSIKKVCKSAKDAMRNPMDRLKARLTNIMDHFDDVTSFWSRGRSPECKKMCDSIGELIKSLGNDNAKLSDIALQVSQVKKNTQGYLDAKHAQNISKTFASEQRYWRLSKSEEALAALTSAENMFTSLFKDPNVRNVEQYIENSKDLLTKTPADFLNGKIVEGHKRTEVQKENIQKTETIQQATV